MNDEKEYLIERHREHSRLGMVSISCPLCGGRDLSSSTSIYRGPIIRPRIDPDQNAVVTTEPVQNRHQRRAQAKIDSKRKKVFDE